MSTLNPLGRAFKRYTARSAGKKGGSPLLGGIGAIILATAAVGWTQDAPTSSPATDTAETSAPAEPSEKAGLFKKMSLDELMNIEVTLVSKRPEKLAESASAIQVITGEDIRRSGATNLPEALELASNLRVAQVNSYGWVISSRGFSALFANKLQVMIDGRSVYTPLFAGVEWDVQNVVLEDIDRIEVVSGPGGALWGANAVNGVINVVTKTAKDTQGLYLSGAGGTFMHDWGTVRYGGRISENVYYRVFAERIDRDNTFAPTGKDDSDAWGITHGGFRMDYYPSLENTFMLQADAYKGTEKTAPADSLVDGQYLLGRWTHTVSADSNFSLQLYADRTYRDDSASLLIDEMDTYDIDFQHMFPLGQRQSILWGLGYRSMQSEVTNGTTFVGYVPNHRDMDLFSGFVQDEITIVPDRLKLTVGTKVEHNTFSGFEVQPSARLAWTPDDHQTVWAAVSRAVRAPSRIDVDFHIPTTPVPPGSLNVNGGPNFDSEKLVAYELGYRVEPTSRLALSLATFYNSYDDLYSVEPLPGTLTYEIQNGTEGQSWGAEFSGTLQATDWLRLRGGYTYFHKDLWNKPGHSYDSAALGNDPDHQVLLQSMMDLPGHFEFDVTGRYVSALPNPHVEDYFALDVRLAKQIGNAEFSVVGQNLLDNRHPEFLNNFEIPRGVYAKVTLRW